MPYRWTLTDLVAPYLGSETLTKDPIGWDEGVYSIKRSEIYKGAFHEYTTSLKFHCNGGGKEYIDSVYASEDIDGRIHVLVEYDCDGSGTYDELFTGIINLASYKTDGQYTTVNIERSDLLTKLFGRDEINVDLETTTSIGGSAITAVDPVTLPMHSSEIIFQDEWVIDTGYGYSFSVAMGKGDLFTAFNSFNMGLQSSDIDTAIAGSEYTDLSTSVIEENLIQPLITFNEPGIIYPITVTWEINWQGTFTDDESTGGGLRDNIQNELFLIWGKKNKEVPGSINSQSLYANSGFSDDNFVDNFSIVDSGTITINQGDSIWLSWFVEDEEAGTGIGSTATSVVTWAFERSTFKITAPTYYKETTAKSLLVHEAFMQVVDSIADGNDNFRSDFYGRTDSDKHTYADDGCGSLIAITNGLNIREFDRPVLCSFKDLFNVFDALHNIGAGFVDGKIRVEPVSYWFDNTTKIISLPNVNHYEQKNDNTRYINKVQIGYQKWESEFHGGLFDIAANQEYSTIVGSVKSIYSKLCKYISSTYTIEFTRRKNKIILPSTDWRYDNDNFLIALKRGSAYTPFNPELYEDSFSNGANLDIIDTAYNIRFTPKRMLLAHLGTITAGLQIIRGAIKFVTSAGNTEFEAAKTDVGCPEDYSGEVLAENADIQWNDTDAAKIEPLWLPEIYTIEYPITYQEFKTIKANPYGYVEFWKTETDKKYGYIMSMERKMKSGLTKFELLKTFNPQ